jgi:hypothetical protein
MNKEQIKSELISRGTRISESINRSIPKSNEKFGVLKDLTNRGKSTEDLTKKLTDELNKIIIEKKISFQANEKQELINYLKPTIKELIQNHITKK